MRICSKPLMGVELVIQGLAQKIQVSALPVQELVKRKIPAIGIPPAKWKGWKRPTTVIPPVKWKAIK